MCLNFVKATEKAAPPTIPGHQDSGAMMLLSPVLDELSSGLGDLTGRFPGDFDLF
jgi:hypothetical protein